MTNGINEVWSATDNEGVETILLSYDEIGGETPVYPFVLSIDGYEVGLNNEQIDQLFSNFGNKRPADDGIWGELEAKWYVTVDTTLNPKATDPKYFAFAIPRDLSGSLTDRFYGQTPTEALTKLRDAVAKK